MRELRTWSPENMDPIGPHFSKKGRTSLSWFQKKNNSFFWSWNTLHKLRFRMFKIKINSKKNAKNYVRSPVQPSFRELIVALSKYELNFIQCHFSHLSSVQEFMTNISRIFLNRSDFWIRKHKCKSWLSDAHYKSQRAICARSDTNGDDGVRSLRKLDQGLKFW